MSTLRVFYSHKPTHTYFRAVDKKYIEIKHSLGFVLSHRETVEHTTMCNEKESNRFKRFLF